MNSQTRSKCSTLYKQAYLLRVLLIFLAIYLVIGAFSSALNEKRADRFSTGHYSQMMGQ